MYYRAVLLLASLFLCPALNAQSLHHSYHHSAIDIADCIAPIPDGGYLIGGSIGQFQGWPVFRPYLMAIDQQGDVLWEHTFSDIEYTELGIIEDIVFDEGQGMAYLIAYTSGCDYGLPHALYQVSPEGDISLLAELEYEVKNIDFIPNLGPIIQYYYYNIFHYYDIEHATLQEIDVLDEYSFFTQSIVTADSTRLAAVDSDQAFLIRLSATSPSIEGEANIASGKDISYLPSDDAFVVLGAETLYKLNGSSLETENVVSVNDWGAPIRVKCANHQVYVLFYKNEMYNIIVFDHLLNFVEEVNLSPAYNHATDFEVQGNRIVVTGYANSSLSDHPYSLFYDNLGSDIFVRSYNPGQSNPSGIDIGLSEVRCSDTTITILDEAYCNGSIQAMSLYFSNIQLEVTNQSEAILNDMVLNVGNNICSFICPSASVLSQPYSNLNLPPGQSSTLTLGNFSTLYVPYQDNYELCIWASSPNGYLDDNFTDNISCMPVDITTIVSADTPGPLATSLKVYPNPATDVLYIDTGETLAPGSSILIKDVLGASLQQMQAGHNQQVHELNVAHLPAGTYFVSVETHQNINTQKWVKY
jgi:hypothetical protein